MLGSSEAGTSACSRRTARSCQGSRKGNTVCSSIAKGFALQLTATFFLSFFSGFSSVDKDGVSTGTCTSTAHGNHDAMAAATPHENQANPAFTAPPTLHSGQLRYEKSMYGVLHRAFTWLCKCCRGNHNSERKEAGNTSNSAENGGRTEARTLRQAWWNTWPQPKRTLGAASSGSTQQMLQKSSPACAQQAPALSG